ncbi:hypothetical protein BDC45DRAFT_42904 [Circinella umbellata]|nr:hypothetical protein BDC45DRAFT_42904 [Circinella umbellata]
MLLLLGVAGIAGVAGVGNCNAAGGNGVLLLLGEPVNNDEGEEGNVTMPNVDAIVLSFIVGFVVIAVAVVAAAPVGILLTAATKSWSESGDGKSCATFNNEEEEKETETIITKSGDRAERKGRVRGNP